MKYRYRPHEVQAVQWTAHNLDEVRSLCPDAFTRDSGWTLAIPIPKERQVPGMRDHLVAHAGYYVVRFNSTLCLPMKAEDFEAAFEQVTE